MRVIEGSGDLSVALDPESGKITYTGSGSASVIFTYTAKAGGKNYSKATEVVTLKAEKTPEQTTDAPQTEPAVTTEAPAPAKSGCGSALTCAVMLIAALGGAYVTVKRKK